MTSQSKHAETVDLLRRHTEARRAVTDPARPAASDEEEGEVGGDGETAGG